ncbi:phospholipase A1 member A-like [Cataglyphis hispanica]|uniref:phospholipase A1 member A-like n=1 Tax=Cataglyphis hispanica TaxID=1086592 RepID=UPI00217FEA6E|nr:phospholipase A1 member A-like [Cataglyphis hispanica]XP_050451499.1 phospholipase A1 member A-like [Cataglyphis hispanica]XP_050451500.1 phospholipase A1 member A-like [Cataglyphis hispanica]
MIHISQQFAVGITMYAAIICGGSVADLESIFLRIYVGTTIDKYVDYSLKNTDALLSQIQYSKPTILYIHGYSEHLEKESVQTIVQAYLKRNDHNIIAVDYGKLVSHSYLKAVRNVPNVAAALTVTLNNMIASGFNSEKLHIVSHSLGSQIAGYIGRSVSFQIPRITGLDPAGPFFNLLEPRLTFSDARFVDIIHTDVKFYGIAKITGTVDFFPNGGLRVQPGCPLNATINTKQDFCSHHRSWRFYAESLTDESAFQGVECPSLYYFYSGKCNNNTRVIMGYGTPSNAQGSIYLMTADQSPFGLHEEGTHL